MRLVELARVTDAQRNLVGIGWVEFKGREGLEINVIAINSPPTANAVTSSLNIQRGGAGLLRS